MRLGSHLVVLVLAVLLPLLAYAIFAIDRNLAERDRFRDRVLRDATDALSLAVDGEVRGAFRMLETLAASPYLDIGDLRSFHELCVRAVAGRAGFWIILFEPTGQQVVNSSRPFGATLPNPFAQTKPQGADPAFPDLPLGGAAPVRKVLETGKPVVSDLFVALDSRKPTIGVGFPVVRDGRVRYVLEMSVDTATLQQLLLDERLPGQSGANLIDARGMVIARSLDWEGRMGRRLVSGLASDLAQRGREPDRGVGDAHTVEGVSSRYAYTRSGFTGWTVTLAMSGEAAAAPRRQATILFTAGAMLALVIGLGAAFFIGRRISLPLTKLAGSAEAMARGESSEADASTVGELEELRRALEAAGRAARQAAEERERAVVNHVLDGIITIDGHGTITSFNPAAERLFGYPVAEAIGQNVKLLMPEPYRREHDGYIANYQATGEAKIIGIGREVVGRRKDGSTFPMELGVSEFSAGPKRFFTGIVRDITERKKLEEALRESEAVLREADRQKDEFLAMLGHELRNPLSALMTAGHLLRVGKPGDAASAGAQGIVERQAEHMARIVEDLLDITRVRMGKVSLRREVLDLAEVVSDTVQAWRLSGRADSRATVRVETSPAWVHADRVRMQQIFSNLLDNAVKFTPADGAIEVSVGCEEGEAVLRVSDSGRGIAPDALRRVFEPFVQESLGFGGLGLGLALVKRLAELHGGSVSAESGGAGGGATFTVRLPAVAAPGRQEAAPASERAGSA